jgi:radical SAM protein with 4Fe4S-binding SPASM domain
LKIRDYLGINTEKEAELKAKAIFSQERNSRPPGRKEKFSPFEKAVREGISPEVKKISKGDIPYPALARVYLSYTCKHNCSRCHYGGDHRKEIAFMNSDSFSKLLESLHCLKVKFIDLSGGGEPTLHPEFRRFAQMCIKEKFKLSLLTNAASLDQKIVSLLVEGFSFLRVNLDASNDVVYNRIHHPPAPREFQKVLGNIERIVSERDKQKSDLVIGAKVRLDQGNMNFMEEMTCLVRDVGLDYIQFRFNQKVFDSLLPEQTRGVSKLVKELKNRYHPFEVYGEAETGRFRRGCWLSPIHLIINPSGDVYSCPRYAYRLEATRFGNIFTQPVEKLWFGSEHRQIVEQLRENDCPVQDCRWHFYNELV